MFFTEFVQPICLPTRAEVGETFVGKTMTVSGWGLESDVASGIAKVSGHSLMTSHKFEIFFDLPSFLGHTKFPVLHSGKKV